MFSQKENYESGMEVASCSSTLDSNVELWDNIRNGTRRVTFIGGTRSRGIPVAATVKKASSR
jgi:hypothetical protein